VGLAGVRTSVKYDKLYTQTVGLGLTDDVQLHAARLCNLQPEAARLEMDMGPGHTLPDLGQGWMKPKAGGSPSV